MRQVKIRLVLPELDGKGTMEKVVLVREDNRLSELSYMLALMYPDCERHNFKYRTNNDPLEMPLPPDSVVG